MINYLFVVRGYLVLMFAFVFISCGGGGGGGGESGGSTSISGLAALGPLSGASIDVIEFDGSGGAEESVYTTTASTGDINNTANALLISLTLALITQHYCLLSRTHNHKPHRKTTPQRPITSTLMSRLLYLLRYSMSIGFKYEPK